VPDAFIRPRVRLNPRRSASGRDVSEETMNGKTGMQKRTCTPLL